MEAAWLVMTVCGDDLGTLQEQHLYGSEEAARKQVLKEIQTYIGCCEEELKELADRREELSKYEMKNIDWQWTVPEIDESATQW